MRYILVTGGLGFIGSNFVNYLAQKYPSLTIVIYDICDYCASKENIIWNKNVFFVQGDICDQDKVSKTLIYYNIDTVIHFAAQTHIENSFVEPLKFYRVNILGSCVLFECIRLYKNVECILHVSTDEVYGDLDINEISNENSKLKPTTPYSYSKTCADYMADSYYKVYKLPIMIVRMNNVYGLNQFPEKVIPKFIKQLLNDEKITIQGTGEYRRNFVHVFDIFTAFETILLNGILGEIYNIGISNEYSILDLSRILCDIAGKKFEDSIIFVPNRQINDYRYNIDNTKIKKLGWKPCRLNFKEELKLIYDQYKR